MEDCVGPAEEAAGGGDGGAGTNYGDQAVRKEDLGPTMWHMFVVLVTIIIFRQYKSKLSDHAQDTLQLTGFPI